MAIQMTREQYEKVYGVKPVASSSEAFDTKPAPVRMTRAEYDAIYGSEQKKTPLTRVMEGGPAFPANPEGGVVENIARYVGNIPGAVANLARNIVEPTLKVPGAVAETIQVAGGKEMANAVTPWGIASTVLKGGFRMWQNAGEEIYKNLEQNVVNAPAELSNVQALNYGTDVSAKNALSKVTEIVINDPTLVPSLLYVPKGLKGERMVTNKTTALPEKAPGQPYSKSVVSVADEIYAVENNYAKTRKLNQYSYGADDASRLRIAESNVLDGAVDVDGKLLTKKPGGAIAQYKAQTIDGVEDVVRLNLQKEAATVNLADVERALKERIVSGNFESADLITALNGVKREIAGLKLRADADGNIPLYRIHDAKISTTNRINYATPASESAYRKAVAKTYKEVVEETSKFNVKEVNKVLSMYLGDIKRLEALDGTRVRGGRLGKYTAALAGTGIGMAAGSVGGGVGAALGGVLGGEAAQLLKGKAMSRSFSGGGAGLEKSPVLTKAASEVAYLKKPDVKVTAPKGTQKTKAITKLEDKIAKNVDQQKAAIKAGDFALVAVLKEAYTVLVDMLKDAIKAAKKYNKEAQIGLSLRDVSGGKATTAEGKFIQEAKKYTSAEEFVKAQGKPFYRATVADFDPALLKRSGKGSGLYVTPKKETAASFLDDADVKATGETRKMETLYVSPDARVLKTGDLPPNLRWDYEGGTLTFNDLKKIGGPQGRSDKIVQWASKNGYDVVVFGEDGYRVIVNPDVIRTPSQLTDIWNRANRKGAGGEK